MLCANYLPFSIAENRAWRNCLISFANEKAIPLEERFVSEKTVTADVEKLAQRYIEGVKDLMSVSSKSP